ncbi:unnamed protein product [Linum trigynum]|uniref:Uncharacterized protein n=1 Tax=Linum trigynum TaxID=586398 RepID=A0AAV2FZ89_9ROSI
MLGKPSSFPFTSQSCICRMKSSFAGEYGKGVVGQYMEVSNLCLMLCCAHTGSGSMNGVLLLMDRVDQRRRRLLQLQDLSVGSSL